MPSVFCGDPEIHDEHSHGDLEWCNGLSEADVSTSSLLVELADAEQGNVFARGCQACDALERVAEDAREAVERALAGTIGQKTLAAILTRNGFPVGARAINRHRREGHTP